MRTAREAQSDEDPASTGSRLGRHTDVEQSNSSRYRTWLVRIACAVVFVVMVCACWLAFTGIRVAQEAAALEETLSSIQSQAAALDLTQLATSLSTLRGQAASIDSATAGPVWAVAASAPVVGDDFSAVRTLAETANGVALSTTGLDALLGELAPDRLRAPDGRIDLSALSNAAPAFDALSISLARAQVAVEGISADGLITPVATAVTKARKFLIGAPGAAKSVTELSALLGARGNRTYAVLLLNSAEMRGSGGFLGGWALITANKGKLSLVSVGANDPLVSTGPLNVSGLPSEYRGLWGVSATEWQSVNISANFPYAGRLAKAGLAKLGIAVDGVVALDSKVAAAILAGTGPISAQGVTITGANADAYFTRGIYDDFPHGDGKDAVVLALFGKMFSQMTTGAVDVTAMAKALLPLLSDRRLLVWSASENEEAALALTPLGGQIPSTPGSWTTVALVNGAGNKMDAYLKARVDYNVDACHGGVAPSSLTLTLSNVAPAKLPPYVDQRLDDLRAHKGSTMSLAFVYGPVGAVIQAATLDGKAVQVQAGSELGHPVWRFEVAIDRGLTRRLVVLFREPIVDTRPQPEVMSQPMAIDEVTAATLAACTS